MSVTRTPLIATAAPGPSVSTPDVIDLRLEGDHAIDAFADEGSLGAPWAPGTAGLPVESTLTYEPYYGLREKPFSLSTDPRFLYRSGSHTPVLHELVSAIRRREGLIVLTGDIGTGKTTLCRAMLSQLDRKTFATFVPDPFVTREDLLKSMLIEFGVVSVEDLVQGRLRGASRPDLSYPLYDFLQSLTRIDGFAVLVIDEVQNLSLPLLEEIRILSDMEVGRKLLQVVLVGQPEFDEQLALPRMRQILQRVTVHCRLQPLDRDAAAGYVSHRLAVAGAAAGEVRFTAAAVDVIHAATGGVPRLINLLCDRALQAGHDARVSRIDPEFVVRAMADMRLRMPDAGLLVTGAAAAVKAPQVDAQAADPPSDSVSGVGDEAMSPAEAGAATTRMSHTSEDLLALLDLPAVNLSLHDETHRVESDAPDGSLAIARGRVWQSSPRLRVASMTALAVLGMLTGVSAAGYWLWLRPVWTAPLTLPDVARPGTSLTALGPLVITQPERMPSAEPPSVEAQSAASPAPIPVPVPAPDVTPVAEGSWAIQAGAFANPAGAALLVRQLQQQGLPAFERDMAFGARGVLRVAFAGPYGGRAAAQAALDRLRATPGFEGVVLRDLSTP